MRRVLSVVVANPETDAADNTQEESKETNSGTTSADLKDETKANSTARDVTPGTENEPKNVEGKAGNLKYKGDGYTVELTFDKDAGIPKEATFKVNEYAENGSHYNKLLSEAERASKSDLTYARFFDISIIADGKEIEPTGTVNVSIKLDEPAAVAEDGEVQAVHFTEDGTKVISAETSGDTYKDTTTVDSVAFKTDSFSDFGVIGTGAYQTMAIHKAPAANETFSLSAVKDTKEGPSLGNVTVNAGVFGNNTPKPDSYTTYTFVEAWYDQIKITGIYKDGDTTYATVAGNTVTGIVVSDISKVKLIYENPGEVHIVTYQATVGNKTYTGNDLDTIIQIVGATSVKDGQNISFVVTPQEGYTIRNVTANNGKITAGTKGTYTLNAISANTTVTVELTEVTRYDFTFDGSNSILIDWNNMEHTSNARTSETDGWNSTYTADNTLNFKLKGRNEWSDKVKILNQLSLTISGKQYSIGIPDSVGDRNAVTTTLDNGYTAKVTKENADQYPTYSVIITGANGGKVRGDIQVQTNFKDYDSSEVWAKQIDGVEPIAYSKVTGTDRWTGNQTVRYITTDGQGDQNSRLTPNVFTYYARNAQYNSTYYLKLTRDYPAEDLFLYVENYRVGNNNQVTKQANIINRTPVSSLTPVTSNDNASVQEYNYKFTIPADDSNHDYDDIRIYVKYEPAAASSYTIWYDPDNGEQQFQSPANAIGVNGKFAAAAEPTTKKKAEDGRNYTFQGWRIEGDETNTVYKAADLVTLTDGDSGLTKYANDNRQIILKAVWKDPDAEKKANYQVQVFLMKDDGSYPDAANFSTTESGNIGSTAYLISSEFNQWLAGQQSYDSDKYEYDHQDTNIVIQSNGSSVLKVYYKIKPKNIIIKKTDSKTNKALDGAVFKLTKGAPEISVTIGDKTYDNVEVGQDGTKIEGINVGNYTLTETKAPDGYIIKNARTSFTVNGSGIWVDNDAATTVVQDGKTYYVITIKNEAGHALPNTGGTGTLPCTFGGLAIIAMAGLMYGFVLRRNNRERRFK